MPRIKLTDTGLRAIPFPETGARDYWDETLPGFGCRVSRGTKTFVVKLDNTRKSIGRFPPLSLAEARAEARRILAERTLGKTRPQSITYPRAVSLFLDEKTKARRASTIRDLTDRLGRHFAFTGQLSAISHQDIVRRLAKIKTVREHNHALRVAKTFFTWAVNRRLISENPTTGVAAHRVNSRARVLSDDEIHLIWQATSVPSVFSTIVRLLLLTGQRRGEIAALRAEYISNNVCSLPSHLTKNGREHSFPISGTANLLLENRAVFSRPGGEYLFSSPGHPGKYFNGWSKAKAQLDKASGVTGWTLHDLRSVKSLPTATPFSRPILTP